MNLKEKLVHLTSEAATFLNNETYINLVKNLESVAKEGRNCYYITEGRALQGPFGPIYGCNKYHIDELVRQGLCLTSIAGMNTDQPVYKVNW